jgi:major membrane immunogen (membrane-anchored lipoprotein)
MRLRSLTAAIALAVAATACGHHDADPQTLADETTRAVYNVDYDATIAHFDDALKAQVTRGTLGQISDEMHALGTYHGLKPVNSDPDKGRYDFQAAFDKGTLLVQLRVDPDQKIGAYRVAPQPSTK